MTRSKPNPSPDPKREFRKLLRASGWSQAEAARQLGMTPSALSQIVRDNSPVRPSPVTLRLFQLLLLREKQAGAPPLPRSSAPAPENPSWAGELYAELNQIDPANRQAVLVKLLGIIRAARGSRNAAAAK